MCAELNTTLVLQAACSSSYQSSLCVSSLVTDMAGMEGHDHLCKVLLVGDAGVGKSRYAYGELAHAMLLRPWGVVECQQLTAGSGVQHLVALHR